jgi:2-polyprenyl-3-methyl-5-hydroxy-6-metoxy-1,4-benzoquinol methylase
MTDSSLRSKYDEIYAGHAPPAEEVSTIKIEPIQLKGWPANLREALIYLARPGGRLLEIGCGAGAVLATLAPHYDEMVGVELSTTMADFTRQGLSRLPHCTVLNVPLEQVPEVVTLPFDCIVWADVIEHIVDVIAAMKIIASLSHPGTQLVTVTPNVAFLPHRLRLLAGHAPTTASHYPNEGFTPDPQHTLLHDAGHLHYFTFRQVEILYRMAGFQPKRRLGIASRVSRPRNVWPTLLSSSVCVSGIYQG